MTPWLTLWQNFIFTIVLFDLVTKKNLFYSDIKGSSSASLACLFSCGMRKKAWVDAFWRDRKMLSACGWIPPVARKANRTLRPSHRKETYENWVKFCCLLSNRLWRQVILSGQPWLNWLYLRKRPIFSTCLRKHYHKKLILSLTEEECLLFFLPFTWCWDYGKLHVTVHLHTRTERYPSVFSPYIFDRNNWKQNNQHKHGTKKSSKLSNIF